MIQITYVRGGYKTVLDSGLHAVDSGLQLLDSGLQLLDSEFLVIRIPIVSGILNSLSWITDSKAQDFRLHVPQANIFSDFGILITIHGEIKMSWETADQPLP